tara:strand:- start:2398 stop:2769 length:372 start_codon:yes stop_codon:yes gene_type:complete
MGFLLFIVAIILNAILLPVALIWAIVEAFVNRGIGAAFKRINEYFFNLAISMDQFGNTTCKELLNDALIKHSSPHKFGHPDETVSSVLGKNKREGTLLKTGRALDWSLDKLDDNHSINSIEQE